jgi:hypothetical protein
MKSFLIKFSYDYYCQGYEKTTEYRLVYAKTYRLACLKLEEKFENVRDFENWTID